jgi:hypothetical protein
VAERASGQASRVRPASRATCGRADGQLITTAPGRVLLLWGWSVAGDLAHPRRQRSGPISRGYVRSAFSPCPPPQPGGSP